MKLKPFHYFVIFIIVAFAGLVGARMWAEKQPGQYDQLAQCIADSGATFYGAFWCPHCNDQKRLFGNSSKLLPYEECSTPDGQNQLPICQEAGIESYPTWILGDGTVQNGVQTPADLASYTGCELPS